MRRNDFPCIETIPLTAAEPFNRDEIRAIGTELIQFLNRELHRPRAPSSRNDAIILSYAKALSTALATYSAILRDEELDEIRQHINLLEAALHESRNLPAKAGKNRRKS